MVQTTDYLFKIQWMRASFSAFEHWKENAKQIGYCSRLLVIHMLDNR